jgi:nucleotide-binding universal stress UspA family protein
MAAASPCRDAVSVTSNNEDHLQRSVVCGVDGSDGARVALRVATRLADELGHRLVVAHVVQPQPTTTGFGPTASQLERLPLDSLLAGGEALVDRILDEEQLGEVERRVVFGFASDRLADLADDEDAELIVVGSRGRRGFKAAWLGSVSADLIAVARRPVLVVPPAVSPATGEGPKIPAAFSSVGPEETR